MDNSITLKDILRSHTIKGKLYKELEDKWIQCYACGHYCKIKPGKDGICKVRFNEDGVLKVPYGYVNGLQIDPIEKKPFFHALPGSAALSFGMVGCDYHCSFCQNWLSSQTLRDPHSTAHIEIISPEDLVMIAQSNDVKIITSTYNEPLITSEWAVEIFKIAKRYKFVTSYVSNGNGNPEVLEFLRPHLDLFKIDLKGFNDRRYRELGGVLQNVLDTINLAFKMGFWVEVVTLVIPQFNDSDDELKSIAEFLCSVSPNIPWHVTAFHPDYKMLDREATSRSTLIKAMKIGKEAGLKFVYAGNLPGRVNGGENTYCPQCNELLIERIGFRVLKNNLVNGMCWRCGSEIPGFWKIP
ncbi:MAG: Radical SAM, Pyruvate-formate lyase-activating enzyme like [Ignavibacteriae bacterium]|nr:MAG: Radical SAM, Pyruvate-formate lyase-activating enzyme like [Ignavibacteriota bacterium]